MSTAQVPPLKAAPGEAPPAEVEPRLLALTELVHGLDARVRVLEAALQVMPAPAPILPARPPLEEGPLLDATLPSPTRVLGLIGRVCLILGGAYLIRALVDARTVPHGMGVALGLAYAATWAILGLRAKRPLDAAFRTLASILIAYPLIVESSTRFGILTPGLAALALVAAAVLHATVAWRRDLHAILWMATLGALGTGFIVLLAQRAIEPFAVAFLALGAGALWLTYGRRWHGLRWPTALAADAGVLILTILAAWPGGAQGIYRGLSLTRALFLALALAAVYIGSFAVRMLQRRRVVNAFEYIQTALVLLVGFGGAVRVSLASGSGTALLGAGVSLAGAGCYAAAVPFVDDQEETRANFNFFTFLALIFLLLGGPFVMPLPAFAAFSGILGLAAMVAALRLRPPCVHGPRRTDHPCLSRKPGQPGRAVRHPGILPGPPATGSRHGPHATRHPGDGRPGSSGPRSPGDLGLLRRPDSRSWWLGPGPHAGAVGPRDRPGLAGSSGACLGTALDGLPAPGHHDPQVPVRGHGRGAPSDPLPGLHGVRGDAHPRAAPAEEPGGTESG